MACDDDLVAREAGASAALDASSSRDVADAIAPPQPLDASTSGVELPVREPMDASSALTDARIDAAAPPDASAPDCSTLGLTYENYGFDFLYLWCLPCHAKQSPTFNTIEDVRLWAPAMRVDTLDTRTMPPSGNANYLRDPQREQFARWLDCGAP